MLGNSNFFGGGCNVQLSPLRNKTSYFCSSIYLDLLVFFIAYTIFITYITTRQKVHEVLVFYTLRFRLDKVLEKLLQTVWC